MGDWAGDRYITDGDRNVAAPTFHKDDVWLFIKDKASSIRFDLNLRDILDGDDDDDGFDDEGFEQ